MLLQHMELRDNSRKEFVFISEYCTSPLVLQLLAQNYWKILNTLMGIMLVYNCVEWVIQLGQHPGAPNFDKTIYFLIHFFSPNCVCLIKARLFFPLSYIDMALELFFH